MYTEDQLYDMLDASIEQKLSFRLKRDILNIYRLTPRQAYNKMTDDYLGRVINCYVSKLMGVDKERSKLGLREPVFRLALEERYYGLKYSLEKIVDSDEKAIYELIKKMLNVIPRELMLVSKVVKSDEDSKLLYERVYNILTHSKTDPIFKDILYIVNNKVKEESLYKNFVETMREVVNKLRLYHELIYEELYYNPQTLRVAIRYEIKDSINKSTIDNFPLEDYLGENNVFDKTYKEDDLYIDYIKQITPVKPTKVLERLWEEVEDWFNDEDNSFSDEEKKFYKSQFRYGKYLFNGGKVVSLRDGLLVIDKTGEYSKLASSKVKKADLEKIKGEFLGGIIE